MNAKLRAEFADKAARLESAYLDGVNDNQVQLVAVEGTVYFACRWFKVSTEESGWEFTKRNPIQWEEKR